MSTAGHKTIRLLLADDNPLVRELIVKGLEPFCAVETSTDGADALLKVVDAPPDVILCDYKMPGLDGRQLFEKLRARESTRHIPFLFMASRPDIEERLRPLVDGVEDFMIVQHDGAQGELYFASGQCRDAKIGKLEGDDAVYKVVLWTAGEFEIDFNAANASTRTTTTRNTTGLLMEAMRLMDEANRDTVETP